MMMMLELSWSLVTLTGSSVLFCSVLFSSLPEPSRSRFQHPTTTFKFSFSFQLIKSTLAPKVRQNWTWWKVQKMFESTTYLEWVVVVVVVVSVLCPRSWLAIEHLNCFPKQRTNDRPFLLLLLALWTGLEIENCFLKLNHYSKTRLDSARLERFF